MKFQNSGRAPKTVMQDVDWVTKLYLRKFQQPCFVEMTSFISVYTLLLMVEVLTKATIKVLQEKENKILLHNNFSLL